jgi:glucose/arabinose dehydrogenase
MGRVAPGIVSPAALIPRRIMARSQVAIPLVALAFLSCAGAPREGGTAGGTLDAPGAGQGLALELVASGFDQPVHVMAPSGDPRLFVVEQPGRILIVRDSRTLPTPFLDIRERVGSGGERGLLSVAFHPRYESNGRFYVNYTDKAGDTHVARFTVSRDPNRADPASERTLLVIEQPYSNHNGGHILFGPDGMLYIGMGDGGSAGDPQGNGQDRSTLLGDLLRIDVDRGEPYAIPAGNPFAGREGMRPEIWAWGLRNPWRIAFDPEGRFVYIADVGQNRREEIDVADARRAGINYGWNVWEGTRCFRGSRCDSTGMTMPVVEVEHPDGCSITGGYVYRGRAMPRLAGHYFYSDYCAGWIRSFRWDGSAVRDHREWKGLNGGAVSSFGEDGAGELYLVSHDGRIHRFVWKGR